MDEQVKKNDPDQIADPAPEQDPPLEHYVPRPKWQLACAWVALVLFLIFVAVWYYGIAHKY